MQIFNEVISKKRQSEQVYCNSVLGLSSRYVISAFHYLKVHFLTGVKYFIMMPFSPQPVSPSVAFVVLQCLEVVLLESVLVVARYQAKSTEPHIFQLVEETLSFLTWVQRYTAWFLMTFSGFTLFPSMCYLFVCPTTLAKLTVNGAAWVIFSLPCCHLD